MNSFGLLFLLTSQTSARPLAKAATGDDILLPASVKARAVKDGGRTILVPDNMVYVPGGDYPIGSGGKVPLGAYCIGKYDVTNAEYKAFLDATRSANFPRHWRNGSYPEGKANHPVVYVSLTMAKAYAEWVSRETGRKAAIPTSEQWEVAARGPDALQFPWGSSSDVSYAGGVLRSRFNYNGVTAAAYLRSFPDKVAAYLSIGPNGTVRGWADHQTRTGFIYSDLFAELNRQGGNTSAVGAYPDGKSVFGCYDMAGNVWNWCDTQVVATNGAERGKTVNEIRGGSWYANLNSCRSTYRGEGREGRGAYNTVGFRIVVLPG